MSKEFHVQLLTEGSASSRKFNFVWDFCKQLSVHCGTRLAQSGEPVKLVASHADRCQNVVVVDWLTIVTKNANWKIGSAGTSVNAVPTDPYQIAKTISTIRLGRHRTYRAPRTSNSEPEHRCMLACSAKSCVKYDWRWWWLRRIRVYFAELRTSWQRGFTGLAFAGNLFAATGSVLFVI